MLSRALPGLALLVVPVAAQFRIAAGATGDTLVRTTDAQMRALAHAPDGTMWTVVYQQGNARDLFLRSSKDGGQTWSGKHVVPMPPGELPNSLAAIHMDRACDRLHVAFSAGNPNQSAYHIEFDITTLQWIGQPTLLSPKATSTNTQMYAKDVVVTDRGSVVVLIQSHRGPPANWAQFAAGGWASAVTVRTAGSSTWGPRIQINKETYGVAPNAIAAGEVIHLAFRSNIGGYGINYRAFDTVTGAFLHDDVHVGPNENAGIQASNASMIAQDAKGGLYVLYTTPGKVRLAYSKAGSHSQNSDWADLTVASDPGIKGGNVTNRYYSLATATGGAVYAVYGKPTEVLHSLYARIYLDGAPVGPELPLKKTTAPNTFEWVVGFRNSHVHNGARFVTWGRAVDPPAGAGAVDYWRPGGSSRAIVWGLACRGSRPVDTRLWAATAPAIGVVLQLDLTDNPSRAPGALVVGSSCAKPPLDLGAVGMPTCKIWTNIALTTPFVADSAGLASIKLAVPNNPGLIDLGVQFQGFTIAAGANPGGAVVSNALAAIF